jgi:phosphatidylserine/phosphatidylglycerophosphate/cardiolipin synthase-like enzyme
MYTDKNIFVHAKALVADGKLSIAGTANMGHRSFELNFEVNATVFHADFVQQLRQVFQKSWNLLKNPIHMAGINVRRCSRFRKN